MRIPLLLCLSFLFTLCHSQGNTTTSYAKHTVLKGETLYHIAVVEYGLTLDAVLKANPTIGSDFSISVGQELNIPLKMGKTSANVIPVKNVETKPQKTSLSGESNSKSPVVTENSNTPALVKPSAPNESQNSETKNSTPTDNSPKQEAKPVSENTSVPSDGQKSLSQTGQQGTGSERTINQVDSTSTTATKPVEDEKPVVAAATPSVQVSDPPKTESNNDKKSSKSNKEKTKKSSEKDDSKVKADKADQKKVKEDAQAIHPEIKYRRSSLYMVMIDDAKILNANAIKDAFTNAPLPDKFNNHCLQVRSFDPSLYSLTEQEKAATGAKKENAIASAFKPMGKGMASSVTGGLVDTTDARFLPQVISKYLSANHVAKDMVAKWFNRDAKGCFSTSLLEERGSTDASAIQKNIASGSERGINVIKDAGEELIGNTFIVITRFKFISKKEIYDAAQALLKATGVVPKTSVPMTPQMQALKDAAIKKLTEGYVVECTSYLYQLVWNDSIQAVFNQNLYMEPSDFDSKKKEAFDNTDLFSLKYIGDGKAMADVPLSLTKKRSDAELIAAATVNSSNAVIAKLQRQYEVFKTKTPLYSGNPITAKIGLKEGLEKGDKFEVLEQTLDDKTGKLKYVRKGTITVDKDKIWDNNIHLEDEAQETPALGKDGKPLPPKPVLTCSTFSGGSKYYSGLLIRQIK